MQKYLNACVWGLLFCLGVLCVYASTRAVLQQDSFTFCCDDDSWLIMAGVFLITFYHVVPMSLYVCFEVLKLILRLHVNRDISMKCPDTEQFAVARTSDLVEEMGQINFVFSDKTGTLTKNEMIFATACVGGQDLGDFRDPLCVQEVFNKLSDPQAVKRGLWKDAHWFFTCLATCHSVIVGKEFVVANGQTPEGAQLRSIPYLGMSPDEVALVAAARDAGIAFFARAHRKSKTSTTSSEVSIMFPDGAAKVYKIMYELEFTSDRKRMSVVVLLGSELFLITKGADNVMETLLQEPLNSASKNHLKQYSQQGLRTLVVASKKLNRAAFREWEKEYKTALSSTQEDEMVCWDHVLTSTE
jgi:magnesium-transporting ATPase (P-type)